jgi:hypothetical protein
MVLLRGFRIPCPGTVIRFPCEEHRNSLYRVLTTNRDKFERRTVNMSYATPERMLGRRQRLSTVEQRVCLAVIKSMPSGVVLIAGVQIGLRQRRSNRRWKGKG